MSRVHHLEGDGHEARPVHRRADHRDPAGAGSWAKTADVCRKYGVSSATFYKWKAKYGGLDVSDAKRLKTLEHENTKLKKLLVGAMLDNAMLKEIAAKKW
jgi:putative transposase